jgi:ubiquitin carboxyl-terminal hydrolase 5/13
MERAEHAASGRFGSGGNPGALFDFVVEERLESNAKVRYKKNVEKCLMLAVPMEAALNLEEVAAYNAKKEEAATASPGAKRAAEEMEAVVPDVPFAAALDGWKATEEGVSFRGGVASKRQRFATFPPLLAVQIRREVVGADWVPKKLEVSLHMPETLDLSSLRGVGGLQPGEAAMEEDAADSSGGGGAAGAEAAADAPVPEEALMMLMSMGFEQAKCEKALRATDMNIERASEWIFSHMDDDGGADDAVAAAAPAAAGGAAGDSAAVVSAEGQDGAGHYELAGFISHIGKSVTSGHYVCHLKKEGRWLVFNDEKVQECPDPPLECGYLYFYRRRA